LIGQGVIADLGINNTNILKYSRGKGENYYYEGDNIN